MLLGWVGAAHGHVPVVYITGPTEDWCAVINGTIGNDMVFLAEGEYTGPCEIRADLSDVPAEQTTVASLDGSHPAVFVGASGDLVLRFSGERLLLRDVRFAALPAGVDAIRVGTMKELWVSRVTFESVPGAGIRQEGVVDELRVLDSGFYQVDHPLIAGPSPLLILADDLIVGAVRAFELGPGSVATVEDVVLVDVGEGLVADDADLEVVGSFVQATGAGVRATGGELLLTSSIVGGSPSLQADGAAALTVEGNTFTGPLEGIAAGEGFRGNAVLGALPAGAEADGNVACDERCFFDLPSGDYSPAPGGELVGAGAPGIGEDWCGRVRAEPPAAGALEATGDVSFGPVAVDFKSETDCTTPDDDAPAVTTPGQGSEAGVPSERGPSATGGPPGPGGCGCAGAPGSPVAVLGLGLGAARIRGSRTRRR